MLQELDGKVAVITGGGSGIGASLARACAAAGMKVVVVDVNDERAAAVAAELPGGTAVSRAVDVSDADAVQALADFAFDTYGAVHLLCNNAGISPAGRIWDFTDDEWQTLLGVNVRGVANGIRSFVPRMIDQGEGHIVNTGSGASFVATVRLGPYCATKHAIVGLSEGLRYELDGTGIGVSVLVPAGVNTNIGDSMVRPSATDQDAIMDDFNVLTGALDATSLEMIEPDVVAEVTLVGVREGWDYIVMGPGQEVGVTRRYREVLDAHRRSKERFPFLPLASSHEQVWKTRAMGELPAGTVTFLFTDLEGSTRLWEEHPEAMKGALARHDAILRGAVDANGGTMVKTTGDGIHAAFPTADDALAAALAIRTELAAESFDATGPLRVRMGVHTCEAELRDGDYYGSGVNRAARLMSVAHGGQIVVSTVTAGLCDDAFPLVDLGEHRLRDLSRAEHVWQVDVDGEHFPQLRSLDNLPGNLPVQLTEFVGRSDDVVQIANALDAHRVVTLTGVGGVGKTRLAVQVAAEFADRFRHGTWFCDLAPVATPEGVVGAIADVLGIDAGTVAPDQALTTWLRHHQALLVIDNCEHLLDEAARVVEELVRGCAELSILATSREGLGAPGEQILTVRSLGLPADGAAAATTVETEAVRLFLDRARSVRSDLPLEDRTVAAIGEICRRLDGIPLAIELAAARVQSMSAVEISERLDQRFRLLTRGSRVALGRQHTLQTTVDWSYQLLDDAERTVLAGSSVFAGGFTLSAAERVVATDDIDRFDVLDLLDSLVRRSMLVADERDGTTRYRLLETIRQFGADRLEETGDAEAARAADLSWCREFMADASIGLRGIDGTAWVARLDRELDNWRAAIAYAIETSDLDALAELFGSITTLALYGTRAGNAFAAAAADTLAEVGEPDHAATAPLLALVAYEQYLRADYAGAVVTGHRGCRLAELHPPPVPTLPWGFVYASAFFGQDFETALHAADSHVRIGHAMGDAYTVTEGHGLRALALATLGRTDEASRAAAEASASAERVEGTLMEMHSGFMVGFTHSIVGDEPELVVSLLERTVRLATVLENPFFATSALGMLTANIADPVTAAVQLRSALELFRTLPQREVAHEQLWPVAAVLHRAGRDRGATTIFGAAPPFDTPATREQVLEFEAHVVAELGQDHYDELRDQGRALTIDEALAFAIAELDAIIDSAG